MSEYFEIGVGPNILTQLGHGIAGIGLAGCGKTRSFSLPNRY